MSSESLEGTARQAGGRIEEAVGGLTGDTERELSGKARRFAGSAQESLGGAADEVADYVADQPLASLLIAGAVGFLLGALIVRR